MMYMPKQFQACESYLRHFFSQAVENQAEVWNLRSLRGWEGEQIKDNNPYYGNSWSVPLQFSVQKSWGKTTPIMEMCYLIFSFMKLSAVWKLYMRDWQKCQKSRWWFKRPNLKIISCESSFYLWLAKLIYINPWNSEISQISEINSSQDSNPELQQKIRSVYPIELVPANMLSEVPPQPHVVWNLLSTFVAACTADKTSWWDWATTYIFLNSTIGVGECFCDKFCCL